MRRLHHVLIANRGEIAVRVLRTARALGYRTTAVYSVADTHAPHVRMADTAIEIGPASVSESYLSIPRIVDAAKRAGADAVHPGYGLLSENAAFARACKDAGLTFIGPSPETIELMGDKRRARIAMQRAGVGCVPGYDGEDQGDDTLNVEAARVGFPLMVKAAAGGGGRGMRRVEKPEDLAEAITRARSEATKAFGDGRLILERAIDGARHVEVQVVADAHGHVLHLGERDCSVQRRFQKVIEEAPSPGVDDALRTRMGELGVLAARSSGYLGIGTVEMLLSQSGEVFFLEMNTRIQVEHPVTELVTGIDLVALQLDIAEGRPLPLTQAHVRMHGHALEARLYAEDPARGFLPATGTIAHLCLPSGEGLRVDHGLTEGLVISAHYDPMLAKIIAHGRDREEARTRLLHALRNTRVLGVTTNQAFLCSVLEHPELVAGTVTTDFLDRRFVHEPASSPSTRAWMLAAALCVLRSRLGSEHGAAHGELSGFTNGLGLSAPCRLACGDTTAELRVEPTREPGCVIVHRGSERSEVRIVETTPDETSLVLDGLRSMVSHVWHGDSLWIDAGEGACAFSDVTYAPKQAANAAGSGKALSPMDGAVVDVPVKSGDRVTRGQTLAVLEAMKLELRVAADVDGTVSAVHVSKGAQVKARQLLVEVQAAAE